MYDTEKFLNYSTISPLSAGTLADVEEKRREYLKSLPPHALGCREIDDNLLLGGLRPGSVVGLSAEEKSGFGLLFSLQLLAHALCSGSAQHALIITPTSRPQLLRKLRGVVETEICMKHGEPHDVTKSVRDCLAQISLSCVFDLQGVWEALAELGLSGQAERNNQSNLGESSPQRALTQHVLDKMTASTPDIIVITHFSDLLTNLFTHREKTEAKTSLVHLSSHLRFLSRTLQSTPLVLLLNATTAGPNVAPWMTGLAVENELQSHHSSTNLCAPSGTGDQTLRSIFRPPNIEAHGCSISVIARRRKPMFGLLFTQMLDLHLLETHFPIYERANATLLTKSISTDMITDGESTLVVEVLFDNIGLWSGNRGSRKNREQRWGAVRITKDRIVSS